MPSELIRFLSLDEAIAIHNRLRAKFGGPPGVRDLGMFESALFRPQTGYYKDLPAMSAALFESLLMNHPFVDGNKRAAFFMPVHVSKSRKIHFLLRNFYQKL